MQLEFNGESNVMDMGPLLMVIDSETNTITSLTPIDGVTYSLLAGTAENTISVTETVRGARAVCKFLAEENQQGLHIQTTDSGRDQARELIFI